MNPAHDDRNAARPELPGDSVSARRLGRERRQPDEIRLDVVVLEHPFTLLVDQLHFPVLRRRGGYIGERERLPEIVAVEGDSIARVDEDELLHAAASMTASSRPTCSKIASARSMSSEVCAAE